MLAISDEVSTFANIMKPFVQLFELLVSQVWQCSDEALGLRAHVLLNIKEYVLDRFDLRRLVPHRVHLLSE